MSPWAASRVVAVRNSWARNTSGNSIPTSVSSAGGGVGGHAQHDTSRYRAAVRARRPNRQRPARRRCVAAVSELTPVDDVERRDIERFVAEVSRLAEPFDRHADPVHVTGSGFVVGGRGIVLLRHLKIGTWLQPGGHLDPGETPWEAARREVVEETGMDVDFLGGTPELAHVSVHDVPDGHTHLDLRYLFDGGSDGSGAAGGGEPGRALVRLAGGDRHRRAEPHEHPPIACRSGSRRSRPVPGREDRGMASAETETRDGVKLTNLDQPLFGDAGATKRDLVDYLDAVADRIVPALADRPLSVIRVQRDEQPFMQKNVPKYTPDWVPTITLWAESSKRDVSYALCNDRRTLLWFANQRAVEYHPTLVRADRLDRVTHLVLDLDPPDGRRLRRRSSRVAKLVRQALADVGLEGAVKTSGAKGLHVFVPVDVGGDDDRGRRGGDPGDRRPRRAARPDDRHDGVHQGRPRRQGVRRLDPGRWGDRRRRRTARVPGPAFRCRSRCAGTTSTPSSRRTSRSTRPSTTSATAIRGRR